MNPTMKRNSSSTKRILRGKSKQSESGVKKTNEKISDKEKSEVEKRYRAELKEAVIENQKLREQNELLEALFAASKDKIEEYEKVIVELNEQLENTFKELLSLKE